jgi:serine/threonine protein kinase
MEYAHYRGVINRDLKAANILLDQNGNPRVTELGWRRPSRRTRPSSIAQGSRPMVSCLLSSREDMTRSDRRS